MSNALLFLGIILMTAYGCFIFHRNRRPGTFRRKPVLTGPDAEIFKRLRDVLPECVVAPGVAASSLIEPAGSSLERREASRRLQGQRVDCAVFDEKLGLLAVIVFGHRARPTRRDARLARVFASAGVRVIRLQPGRPYSSMVIRKLVFGAQARRSSRRQPGVQHSSQPLRTPWRNTANAHA